jgi:hypothetical protein
VTLPLIAKNHYAVGEELPLDPRVLHEKRISPDQAGRKIISTHYRLWIFVYDIERVSYTPPT